MDEILSRIISNLIDRVSGPFSFRFVLQPLVAALYAVHDGLLDARHGRPVYFWSILTDRTARRPLLREGWHHVMRVIIIGTVMDVLYQVIVFKRIYPFELIVIVLGLAFVPYLLLRGPVNRLARLWADRKLRA